MHAYWHILVAAVPHAYIAFHAQLLTTWPSVSLWSRFSSRAIVPLGPSWARWSRHALSPCRSGQTFTSRRNGHKPGPMPRRSQHPDIPSGLYRVQTFHLHIPQSGADPGYGCPHPHFAGKETGLPELEVDSIQGPSDFACTASSPAPRPQYLGQEIR